MACPVVLHSFWKSTCSWRVRTALAWKRIPYEYRGVNIRANENKAAAYTNLNPNQKVPSLYIDGHLLTQSSAILAYLEETRPDPPLLPSDPIQRAHVRSFCDIIGADIQPIQNLAVLREIARDAKDKDAVSKAWASKWITRGFDALETRLKASSGKFCFGDAITLADVYLVPQVNNAIVFGVDMDAYPYIQRINETLLAEDAFRKSHPSQMPDCPPALSG
ncbi:Aste57867_22503 [Aphanomyces stellatus]|uniref:Aste57867_22503 protein n=1 Tax=Aphanomyces stellatus TaxID=120398 RepID=A0A485LL40_9STRA|nr:hypothetical protein As57867_022433 [Aphanomyces stellatus]VFT99163.1 Aste57867_22503 [Aphanomyces stellatus]